MSEPKEDTWLIELPDDETRIVTTTQLLEMEKTAEEFDGFYGWRVVKKIEAMSNDHLPAPDFDDDDEFQCCDNCDRPDACADFGCAIKSGLRKTFNEDGIF